MLLSMADDGEAGTRDGQNVSLVYDRLREGILQGVVPAGETSQVALARDLGVGRTPLREALRMLQHEGLVISEPNRRLQVASLTADDAEELYIMRITLEAAAIRITVPTLPSEGIADLEGLTAQMNHYMGRLDFAGFRPPHRAFHARLVAGAGTRVATLISQLFDHAERYRVAFGGSTAEAWDQRKAEHRAMLDAASEGDADLTARLLVEHYARTAALIFTGLGGEHDPQRLRIAIASGAPGAKSALDDPF
jgi:DNA-binding GntR family transcriptional regulator